VERPDKIGMMMQMAKMNMRMGAPAMKFNPSNEEPQQMMNNWGMQMDGKMNMNGMDHSKMKHVKNEEKSEKKEMNGKMDADIEDMDQSQMAGEDQMAGMSMFSKYNYNYLKSPKKTDFVDDKPVKDVLLNLTGNMWRYIWSMNGVPLSEADKIKINDDEVTRILKDLDSHSIMKDLNDIKSME
jgi:hypothetical protein